MLNSLIGEYWKNENMQKKYNCQMFDKWNKWNRYTEWWWNKTFKWHFLFKWVDVYFKTHIILNISLFYLKQLYIFKYRIEQELLIIVSNSYYTNIINLQKKIEIIEKKDTPDQNFE